ncbi:hypothetical protein Tco_1018981 [Tanacetum coccineum]|uniref:Uncharacterized protein n=1 Tax=Tanacetum coccineum TaxID=301880 RepID=A0ABQ5FVT7_9ASTR
MVAFMQWIRARAQRLISLPGREQAAIDMWKRRHSLQMKGYYDAKVRGSLFRTGDFSVFVLNDASHAEDHRKAGTKWEVHYEVTEALGKGA